MVESLGVEKIFFEQAHALVSVGRVLPGGEEGLAHRLLKAAENCCPLKVALRLNVPLSKLHLGHTVLLRKLRSFQDLGHEAILMTEALPESACEENPLLEQIGKVMDLRRLKVLPPGPDGTEPVDVEICGGDEGRYQALSGQTLEGGTLYIVLPYLGAANGQEKMTADHPDSCIYLNDPPTEMYRKLMMIPYELVPSYEALLTPITLEQLQDQMELIAKPPEEGGITADDVKAHFIKWLVTQYYSQEEGEAAEQAYLSSVANR